MKYNNTKEAIKQNENENCEIKTLPVITLRGLVIYPGNKMHLDIGRRKSILAINACIDNSREIFLVAQKNLQDEDPKSNEIYKVGVIAKVHQVLKTKNDGIRIFIEVVDRAKVLDIDESGKYLNGKVQIFSAKGNTNSEYCKALIRTLKNLFQEYFSYVKRMPQEILLQLLGSDDAIFVAEYAATNISIDFKDKQTILESVDPIEKLETLIMALDNENNLIEMETDIYNKLQTEIDDHQKEYYLRQQMKVIAEELGDVDSPLLESETYKKNLSRAKIGNQETLETLFKEVDKLTKLPPGSQEAGIIKSYLDLCLELPWSKKTKDKINIEKAKQILDKDHYGMNKVKDRILELLAVKKLKNSVDGHILCLVGPPGIGKTSIVKSIAKTMGRKYARISLGGIKDESEIRGHRRTYVGSMPGRIINAVKMSGSKNPIILLDELDKMSNDFRGDPASAMLEVLDSEQNSTFTDNYLGIPFDLSDVIFIATANDKYEIPLPLLDRLEIIDLNSYTRNEKCNIAVNHLVMKQLKKHGLSNKDFKITPTAIFDLIDYYTSESGVRNLERKIGDLCRKVAKKIASSMEKEERINKIVITDKNLTDYMGPHKFKPTLLLDKDEVGVVTGLAWTAVGGEVMHIEVSALEGNGKLELTGSLGEVMKESAKAAISYIRSKAEDFGIDSDFYKTKDIHIHVPEGAIPKDGPSAGVTMCTALISELKNLPIKRDVAMTGEITLRGRVLPIGGLKEKSMAAYRTGIKTVIIPKGNEPDLFDIDPVIKESVQFLTADKADCFIQHALVSPLSNLN